MTDPRDSVTNGLAGDSSFTVLCAKKEMRKDTLVLCLLLAGLLSSCQLIEAEFSITPRTPRTVREHRRLPTDTSGARDNHRAELKDTVVWVSAVAFPEGYDWQRDTACGSVNTHILLFRDGVQVLDIPADGAGEAYRHHIAGGHIYSECSSGSGKTVRRDGEDVFTMPQSQTLCGVLEKDGSVFTLAKKSGGCGFVLRRAAETVLETGDGIPLGDFDDTSYAPGGALYEDLGRCCFAFSANETGSPRYYMVMDGEVSEEEQARGAGTLDLKYVGGIVAGASSFMAGRQWYSARIWRSGNTAVAGTALTGSTISTCVCRLPDGPVVNLGPEDGFIYVSDVGARLVRWSPDGSIIVGSQDGQSQIPGTYCVFYPSCGLMYGSDLMLALTPKDRASKAKVIIGDTVREIKVNGFLSGIGVTVQRHDPEDE